MNNSKILLLSELDPRALLWARDYTGKAFLRSFGTRRRGIVNRLIREVGPIAGLAPPFPLASGAITPLRMKSEASGLRIWHKCGQVSPLIVVKNCHPEN